MRNAVPAARSGVALVVLSIVLMAGCARPATASTPTTNPPHTSSSCAHLGQQILVQMCAVKLTDVAFRFQVTGTTEAGNHYSGTGTGMATATPQRFQFSVVLVNGGTTFAWDEIDDPATTSGYQRYSQPPLMASAMWDKLRFTDDAFMVEQTLNYREPQSATLVGREQMAGIAVWHVRASAAEPPEHAHIDVYVRTDTLLPVELVLSITDAVSQTEVTYSFTRLNTGLTVSLPLPNRVASG